MHSTHTSRIALTTGEFAASICRSAQAIRALHCRTGQAFGIRPAKVGRMLLWPADEVAKLLNNSTPPQAS